MGITINKQFSKKGPGLVCCQRHITSTSYHATNFWLQNWINLVYLSTGQIPIEKNLALNNLIDPKIVLGFSACITCLNANRPVSKKVGVRITSILTHLVLHDRLEPYTKV